MNKKPKIKVTFNIWGNYVCFIGSKWVERYNVEFDAQTWLNEHMATGEYVLSDKSDLKTTEQK